jgi:flagellar assembly factor FliW
LIIENTRFGTIEIDEEKIIHMTRSMPGFPGKNRYILLNREESKPFLWYQCVDDPKVAFVIIDPHYFKPDFSIDLKVAIAEMSWTIEEKERVAVFVIVNASHKDPEKITANLMAPLLVNTAQQEAFQMIIPDSAYSHRYPIFDVDNAD